MKTVTTVFTCLALAACVPAGPAAVVTATGGQGVRIIRADPASDSVSDRATLLVANDSGREIGYLAIRCTGRDETGAIVSAPWGNMLTLPAGEIARIDASDISPTRRATRISCRVATVHPT